MAQVPPAHPATAPPPLQSDASILIHEELTEFEKELLPAWLDRDPAADQPNYLGIIMSLLPAALLALFAFFAFVLISAR